MKKITKFVLKKMSSLDIDLEKNYKKNRIVNEILHFRHLNFSCKTINYVLFLKGRKIPIRLYFPKGEEQHEIILFFHGGGWVVGNINTYDKTCQTLALKTGQIVISVDYRLAPEYPFPCGLIDCYEVALKLFLEKERLGISDITLMGDSAGGNLAAAVSLLARDRGDFSVSKQILIYPAVYNNHGKNSPFLSAKIEGKDYLLTSRNVDAYLRLYKSCEIDLQNPYLAPLLAKDLTNQPKTLIITAEHDPLRDEGEAYGRRLIECKNEAEIHCILETIHGFFNFPSFKRANKETYYYIQEFLNEKQIHKK